MRNDLLHVVTAYSNPVRWKNRLAVYKEFEQHMLDSGVRLTTVECAYGERPFELPDDPNINRVRVRANTLSWNKENLLNIGISRMPEAKYICTADADIFFRKKDWAAEAVHALQQYSIIQPWSDAYDLGPNDEHLQAHQSFCRLYWHGYPVVAEGPSWWSFQGGPYTYSHSGYAWCYTRQALEYLGGLVDTAALGAGDHHMACALVGRVERSWSGGVTESYKAPLYQWENRATRHINRNIGFMWGTVEHRWHGRKMDRRYNDRWKIIVDNKFDPVTDLKRNTWGVQELSGNKPKMTLEIDRYFRFRNEDANTIS